MISWRERLPGHLDGGVFGEYSCKLHPRRHQSGGLRLPLLLSDARRVGPWAIPSASGSSMERERAFMGSSDRLRQVAGSALGHGPDVGNQLLIRPPTVWEGVLWVLDGSP